MEEVRDRAALALSNASGRDSALLSGVEVLRATHDGYPTVGRFRVRGPSDLPSTVVVKRPGNWAHFDPASNEGPARGFFNEWAALEFLDGTSLAPRLLAADRDAGLLVLDDVGDGDGLADSLLGDDAEVAESHLLAFADALAALHAFSAPRLSEYATIRDALAPARAEEPDDELEQLMKRLRTACDIVGLAVSGAVEEDIATAFGLIDGAELRALGHGDPCPDNTRILDGRLKFIDFWVARPRHVLLDGAYARAPFPTCWCVRRIPDRIVRAMEERYRKGILPALPQLSDDAVFHQHLVAALALWLVEILGWHIPRAMESDELLYRDVHSRRQGVFVRVDTFRTAARAWSEFSDMAAFADEAEARLRVVWRDVRELAAYPAFEDDASSRRWGSP